MADGGIILGTNMGAPSTIPPNGTSTMIYHHPFQVMSARDVFSAHHYELHL
jgi:hypothetical protein